jgi:hypothetical protein
MFATSLFDMQRGADPAPCSVFEAGEGLYSESSRNATRELLLPQGRPGAWLLLLGGVCAFVLTQAVWMRLG